MTSSQKPRVEDDTLGRDVLYALRYYLGGRRGFRLFAATALVMSLAFNWSWLVAVGIAPLLLTVLPCVVMCALGLCMNKIAGRACTSSDTDKRAAVSDNTALLGEPSDSILPEEAAGVEELAHVEASLEQSQHQGISKTKATDA